MSVFGRVYLTKMEFLSRCIYPSHSLAIPKDEIKAVNQANFSFIWRNKTHYLQKAYIVKDFKEGGLKVIDFNCLNGMIKLNWIKEYLKKSEAFWYCIPRLIFSRVGGLPYLLSCDFAISKLPIKLSDFHQQVLMYWKLIYKHNFTPHSSPIWNNRYVTLSRKSLYIKEWKEKNICSILDILDDEGNIFSYNTFCVKYGFTPPKRQFHYVIKAIPEGLIKTIQNYLKYDSLQPKLPDLIVKGVHLLDIKSTNKFIRECLREEFHPVRPIRNTTSFTESQLVSLRTKYLKFPIPPKAKEVHFKTINNIYPSKELLHHRFNIDLELCVFCKKEIDATVHIFSDCLGTQSFWVAVKNWLAISGPRLTAEEILFGTTRGNSEENYMVNVVIILGKFFIHKTRYLKTFPHFIVFKTEFNTYWNSLNKMTSKKAIVLKNIICNFI